MAESSALDHIISIIQRCREGKDLKLARIIYAFLCEDSFESHYVLGNYLVSLLVDCGSLSSARYSFDRLAYRKNRYAWSSIISGYIDCGEPLLALELYEKMTEERVQAKNFTYRALLKGCIVLNDADKGREIHASLVKEGLDEDPFIGSVLVDVYGKCGFLLDAFCVFENFPVQDVVLWTNLISSYADQGFVEGVLDCLERMHLSGLNPDSRTFVCSLKGCSITRTVEIGRKIHGEVVVRGLEGEIYVGHTLIDMYAKCGSLLEAQMLFEKLPVRSVIPWTSLITGYADNGFIEEVLSLLEAMKGEGIAPVSITFLCIFRACGYERGALGTGQEMHSLALKMGLEMDESVGTSLIDMYSKCGSFLEAWVVLSQLPNRGSAAWNALISGCADHGLVIEVLNSLNQMQEDGVSPVAITLCCCLKACSAGSHLRSGRKIHSEIVKLGLERDLDLHNSIIGMYVKCDMIFESQRLFDQFSTQDVVAWTTLITGYAEKGLYDEVVNRFGEMQIGLFNLDLVAHICSLKACGLVRATDMGRQVHSQLVKMGLEREITLASALLDMYMKSGFFGEAWAVFNRLPVQSASTWLALIVGYEDHGFSEEALSCFKRMQCDGFAPCYTTYSSGLKACGSMKTLQMGQEIHGEIIQRGLESDFGVGNALVGMYTGCGLFEEAHKLFDKLSKDEALWTTLIVGYAEKGLADEAVCNLEQMTMGGFSPSIKAYISTLQACSIGSAFREGQEIHIELVKRGFDEDIYIETVLVDMYAKYGSVEEARDVLEKQPIQSTVSWNALIAAYADHGLGEEALECFKNMQLEGVLPAVITYACSLESCGIVHALEIGWQIHAETTKRALETDPFIGSALVGMYGKCGVLLEATEVFDQLPFRDVATWNAMIKANGENHKGNMAIQCFEEMQKQGVNPNGITFICLLAACSHASLVSEGRKYFEQMIEHGIKPTWDHYTCMVDLLGRSGYVCEAEQFAEGRNCLQCEEILRTLLNASKIHGEVDVGERCFQQLLRLNKDDAGSYLLMADIYTKAGKFGDANNIEEMRIHAEVKSIGKKLIQRSLS